MEKKLGRAEILVVISCLLMMVGGNAITYAAENLFTVTITRDLGFERSKFMLFVTAEGIVNLLATFFFAYCVRRFNLKKLVAFGFALRIAFYIIFSLGTKLWTFYLAGVLAGASSAFLSVTVIAIVINNWFNKRKGLVLGIVYSSNGFSGLIINPMIGGLLQSVGWRASYRVIALISLGLMCAVLAMLKVSPDAASLETSEKHGFSVKAAIREFARSLKLKGIWILILTALLSEMAVTLSYYNVASAMQDIGFPVMIVSGVLLSVLSMANSTGKLVMGAVNDRFGIRTVNIACHCCCILGCAIIAVMREANLAAAVVACVGIGVGITAATIPFPIMTGMLYDGAKFAGVMAVINAATRIGRSIGQPLCNLVYDTTGSYSAAYSAQTVISVAACALGLYAVRNVKSRPTAGEV